MTPDDKEPGKAAPPDELRRQAEEAIAAQPARSNGSLSHDEALALVHELQVHQVELELQNEELVRTRREAEALRDRYADLYDFAPVGYFTLDEAGAIREVNLAGAVQLGVDRGSLIGARFATYLHPDCGPGFAAYSARVLAGGRTETCEVPFAARGGRGAWYGQLRGRADATGLVRLVVTDITDRRRAEEKVRESEERYRGLVDDDLTGVFICAPAGRILDCNPAFARMFGFASVEEARSASVVETYESPSEREALLDRLRRERRFENDERFRRRRDGTRIHVVENIIGDFDDAGELRQIRGYIIDDTRRFRAEEALRKSEASMVRAQKTAHLGNWEWDRESNLLTCSDEHARIYGLAPGVYPIETFVDLVHEDDRQYILDSLAASLEGGTPYVVECRIVRPNGSVRIVHGEGEPVRDAAGRPTGMFGIAQDITARRQTEDALRETRDFLDSLINHANAPIIVWGPDFRIMRFNAAFERLTGYAADEVIGRDLSLLFPEETRDESLEKIQRTVTEQWESVEIPVLRRDGGVRVALWNSATIHDTVGGTLRATIAQGQDITERKRAEEALQESEELLRLAQENAKVAVWDLDVRTGRQNYTPEFLQLYGVEEDCLRDYERWREYVHPDDIERVEAERNAALARGETFDVSFRIVRPSGEVRWLAMIGRGVRDAGGTLLRVLGVNLDITGRKEDELRIARYSDDLERSNEDLQRFAYVASHDLQEPLRSIISFSQLLERRYSGKLDADADDYIAFIVEGGNRMQTLIQDLLQLSRIETKAKPPAPTDTNTVVNGALRMLEVPISEAGASVTVGALPAVMADAAQLEQVFTNLVSNAIKFRRPDRPPEVRVSAERDGAFWRFAVADNGIGIEPEYYDRIFVIFQRLHTRETYPGTGIGLAIVKRIVDRHGGTVRVESAPGEGSTFYFTLPAAEAECALGQPSRKPG